MLLFTAICWQCLSAESQEFPIDKFKNFINHKGTIENCDFKVLTTKFNMKGLRENTYRPFNLIMEGDTKYRLVEDRRDYFITAPVYSPGIERAPQIKELKSLYTQFCWSRFEDTFESSFNPDGVISISLESSAPAPTFGPSRSSASILGIAYDVLNLGVLDLRNNGVIWTGSRFTCLSNQTGKRIDGELFVGVDSIPKNLIYEISSQGKRFRYEANYEFDRRPDLPEFFPFRITIESVNKSERKTLSDYHILHLTLSNRRLSPDDVAFVAPREVTNRVRYVYTNNEVYRFVANSTGTNKLKRIRTVAELGISTRPSVQHKKQIVILVIIMIAAALILIYWFLRKTTIK